MKIVSRAFEKSVEFVVSICSDSDSHCVTWSIPYFLMEIFAILMGYEEILRSRSG